MKLLFGIDIGTTGTKSMILDIEGNIISSAYQSYEIYNDKINYVEEEAEDWWNAVVKTVKECLQKVDSQDEISALSLSTQGGSMVPVDRNGNPLRKAIVWMDKRAGKEAEILRKRKPRDYYYKTTGWRLLNGMNLAQIKWIKDNEPDIFANTYKFLSTIDYINYKLTGEFIIDPTNSGITNLMNIKKCEWEETILSEIEISEDKLASIKPSGQVLGTLTTNAAKQLGLSSEVKVVNGGHDQYCAALGAGAINNGDTLLATGTAWVVLGINDKPIFDTETYFSPGHHVIDGKWGALASIGTAGVSMEWFRKNIAKNIIKNGEELIESYQDINEKTAEKDIGAEGLTFYPHFNGSGCPTWSDNNRATLLGMDLSHDRYHIARAIMEGVAFEACWILESLEKQNLEIEKLKMLGGATKSKIWTQIVADITGLSIIVPEVADVTCVGAAILAGLGTGIFNEPYQAYNSMVQNEREIQPDSDNYEEYEKLFSQYKNKYFMLEKYYSLE